MLLCTTRIPPSFLCCSFLNCEKLFSTEQDFVSLPEEEAAARARSRQHRRRPRRRRLIQVSDLSVDYITTCPAFTMCICEIMLGIVLERITLLY